MNGSGFFPASIAGNDFYDNNYNVSITDTGSGEHIQFVNNKLVRNCFNSGCSTNPSNLFWSVSDGLVLNNVFQDAGVCLTGDGVCSSSNPATVDQMVIAGSRNTISGNEIAETTYASGECGIEILSGADGNIISGNSFYNNGTDICVAAGATDTRIDQPGVIVLDSGTRTVINGVSTNAGDPNTTGNWNGVAKWAGLIINDTTDGVHISLHEPVHAHYFRRFVTMDYQRLQHLLQHWQCRNRHYIA